MFINQSLQFINLRFIVITCLIIGSTFSYFAYQPSIYASVDIYQPNNSTDSNDLYQEKFNPPDPLKVINQPIFKANLWFDDNITYPIVKVYKKITPEPIDDLISNFFTNLGNATSSFNLLLQGEFKKSSETLVRFGTNTIFGVLGFFDVASSAGINQYKTGLNETLKKWNVGSGTYIVLPIFGSNTPRTIVGRVGDYYTNPIQFFDQKTFLQILGFIDFRADNEDLFELAKSAGVSPYDSIRLFFLNHQMKDESDDKFDDYDDFEPL